MPGVKKVLPLAFAAACLVTGMEAAVTLGQLENFSGLHQWSSGDPHPSPPVVIANSGPLGGGDSSLRVTSNGGSGAGGRLIVFNRTLWTGNYTAAGITAIAANLRNTGSSTLSFRLALNGPGGWFVTPPAAVAAFTGWTQQLFALSPSSLINVEGDDVLSTLAAVTELRILHSTTVDFRGAKVSSSFQVDQIQAIPEPSAWMVLVLAGGGLIFRKR